jgi:hypothetical protein
MKRIAIVTLSASVLVAFSVLSIGPTHLAAVGPPHVPSANAKPAPTQVATASAEPAPPAPLVCDGEHDYVFQEAGDYEISAVQRNNGTTTDASICLDGPGISSPLPCTRYLGGNGPLPWYVSAPKGAHLATFRREGSGHGAGRGWHGPCAVSGPTSIASWVDNNGGWNLKVVVRRLR